MIQYTIPLTGLKESTNKIYAGIHWTKRKSIKDSFLDYARVFCRPVKRVESYPVEICYRFVFGSKPLDTLNTAFMAKMFEDAFRSIGIIEDDSPKYVARSILEVVKFDASERAKNDNASRSKRDEKDKDWVEITIKKYD